METMPRAGLNRDEIYAARRTREIDPVNEFSRHIELLAAVNLFAQNVRDNDGHAFRAIQFTGDVHEIPHHDPTLGSQCYFQAARVV